MALFFPKNFKVFGQSLDFEAFTPLAIIMIVVYFILGYLLYAMFNAVAGASVQQSGGCEFPQSCRFP